MAKNKAADSMWGGRVRESFSEAVTFAQKARGGEATRATWGDPERVPGRGNRWDQHLEVEAYLVCWRNRHRAGLCGWSSPVGEGKGRQQAGVSGGQGELLPIRAAEFSLERHGNCRGF